VLGEREISEAALRKRHQDAVNELTQQLENINRNRTKYTHQPIISFLSHDALLAQCMPWPGVCPLRN